MTSANVKRIDSIMTFVGTPSAPQQRGQSGDLSFGDVMTKAQNGQEKDSAQSTGKAPKSDPKAPDREVARPKRDVKESAPEEVQGQEPKEISEEDIAKLESAGQEVKNAIAEELSVDEEAVTEAMETLNLSVIALLDPTNIRDLVMEVTGESDPIALATNETLFNTVQDLTAVADAAAVDLAEDMDIEISDVSSMVIEASEAKIIPSEMQMSVEADSDNSTVVEEKPEESPEIRVDVRVKEKDDEVTLKVDDKGNVIKTQTVEPQKDTPVRDDEGSEKGHRDGGHGRENESGHVFSQIHTTITEQVTQDSAEVPVPQQLEGEGFLSGQSREIMDQIRDGMRANLRPEMQELELSLHPASLGNVKISLVSKGGEISAEFKVQNELVREIVEAQLNDLKEQLRDTGIKVNAVEVSVETQSFEQNLWQGEERNPENEGQPRQRRPRRLSIDELTNIVESGEATEEEVLASEMMEANGTTVDYTA